MLFVTYYLEYLLNLDFKNNLCYLSQFDKEFLASLTSKVNVDKKRKKLTAH